MIIVNKHLSDNPTIVRKRVYFKVRKPGGNTFVVNRKKFADSLKKDGYSTVINGNFITATRNGEVNTFFFISHEKGLKNYLVPAVLPYRVQYFAFYDEEKDCVYKVAYNVVRDYCQHLDTIYVFNQSEKLFISDSWAKRQVLNTYVVKQQ